MPRLFPICLFVLIASLGRAQLASGEEPRYEVNLSFSRPADVGDNPGTLFEIRDRDGKTLAGAGYLGAYNTFPRSDREELQLYVRSEESKWEIEPLPRIDGTATGYYPFQFAGELYVSTRNGSDSRVHRWDDAARSWEVVKDIPNGMERIAGKSFHVSPEQVTYDGKVLLKSEDSYRFGEHYYAGGLLVLRCYRSETNPPANLFQVYRWNPTEGLSLQAVSRFTLQLPQPREFIYTFGQWHGEILAITNMGGVYRLRPVGWDTLRTPIPTVSYQIYCGINYRDALLLGHYPTGEIYEYSGDQLVLKKEWPPVMPGVSRNAREAQTLALYNGDLYCGVWPWGEVWRYDGSGWQFVQRMFQHPAKTAEVTHPYEAETRLVDKVYNVWGQRVTGMIPFRGSLIITTSSKGGSPWDPKFAFLTPELQKDYGRIYRAKLPGQMSLQLPPSSVPQKVSVVAEGTMLTLRVDGEIKAKIPLPTGTVQKFLSGTTTIGEGLYGRSSMRFESIQVTSPAQKN